MLLEVDVRAVVGEETEGGRVREREAEMGGVVVTEGERVWRWKWRRVGGGEG